MEEASIDNHSLREMLRSGETTLKGLEDADCKMRRFAIDALALYHLEKFGFSAISQLEVIWA